MSELFSLGLVLLLLSGCSSYGVIDNTRQTRADATDGYSIRSGGGSAWGSGDIGLMLAFSGGGTRAAALAYGVLEELRDTMVVIDGRQRRLLDEIDLVSSVSGGSFTSAYDALYGERIFDDFEGVFLRRNVQHQLIRRLLNPLLMNRSVKRWARDLSIPGRPVTPYFIQIGFRDLEQPELVRFFNRVPTSFSLTDEQVDKLIAAGRDLLRNNSDYQQFVASLGGARTAR